jgi:TolB-like protein/Tfp pilus assembly protein PilF
MGTESELVHSEPPLSASNAGLATGFWARVQEHKIIQWGVGYLGAALAIAHGAELLGHSYHWPEIIGRLLMGALIVGFPVALVLAWYHGHRGLKRISAGELGIIAVLLLIGAVFFTVSLRPSADHAAEAAVPADTAESSAAPSSIVVPQPAGEPAPSAPLPNSIAVLPFDNLSPDPNNAFFAAGIHDEVLNQLGKLKSLNVIARTSVMQYANAARPITEIARELGVETVMEGSVSYAEGRVAVRAQLIDANTGVHLWSDSYNREFADVFGIQADIAMNIANALEAEFSDEEQARIEQIPTASSEAYALYLQARAILPVTPNDPRIPTLLQQAIEIDRDFAAAYATSANLLSQRLTNTNAGEAVDAAERAELVATVRRDASRALDLDEQQGLAHSALALLALFEWRWTEAEAGFTRAVEASRQEPIIGAYFGYLLSWAGRHDEAIAVGERTRKLDPDSPLQGGLGFALGMAGDYDAAAALWRRTVQRIPNPIARHWLALTEIARGNNDEALRQLELVDRMLANNRLVVFLPELAYAFGRVGRQGEARRLFDEIEAAAAAGAPVGAGTWAMAYLAIGDNEQALKWLEAGAEKAAKHEPDPGFINLMNLKMNVTNDPILRQPEFVAVLERLRGD